MHQRNTTALLIAAAIAPAAFAQNVEVIYSKVDASTTSDIAGTLDLAGMPAASKWRAIEDFTVRPDGGNWVVKGRTRLGSDLETILVRGTGTSGTMFCQEGQPFQGAAAGELYDFFDTPNPVSYDAAGNIAFSARARGGVTTDNEKVIHVSTLGVHTQVLQQGDLYTGLIDVVANPSGDEIVGNSIGSVTLLDNGQVFFGNTPIGNCHSSRYPALMRGNAAFRQSGVTTIGSETWDSFDYDGCGGSSNPALWFAVGDTENANTAIDKIMAVNDVIVLQEGSSVGGSSLLLGDITQASMSYDGTWAARGRDNSGTSAAAPDWAVRNGVIVAKTGDPVAGGTEAWGDSLYAVAVNSSADWAVSGRTNNASPGTDDVVVVNGAVVMREGDAVDVNGNGLFDDDAFLGRGVNTNAAFAANDLALSDDGYLWAIVHLRNGAGADLNGAAFGTPDAFVAAHPRPGSDAVLLRRRHRRGLPVRQLRRGRQRLRELGRRGRRATWRRAGLEPVVRHARPRGLGHAEQLGAVLPGHDAVARRARRAVRRRPALRERHVVRLGTKFNVGERVAFPAGGDPRSRCAVRAVGRTCARTRSGTATRRRSARVDTFNLTNGVEVTWVP